MQMDSTAEFCIPQACMEMVKQLNVFWTEMLNNIYKAAWIQGN